MKKLLLIILLLAFKSYLSHGQDYPRILQFEVYPENPTAVDSVEIRTHLGTPNYGGPEWTDISLDDTIKIFKCVTSSPNLPAPYHYWDTFQIGKLDTGNYAVRLDGFMTYSWDSCVPQDTSDSTISFHVGLPLGQKFESIQDKNTFYPNPANSMLNIVSSNEFNRITFSNTIGTRNLDKHLPYTRSYQLDLSEVRSGVYLLQLFSDETLVFSELIIRN